MNTVSKMSDVPGSQKPVEAEANQSLASRDPTFKYKAGAFLASVAGISALMGFGTTLSYARRKDPEFFSKGVAPAEALAESGALLATRALAWGTVYAFGGCGILFYGLWKLSGCKDLKEFRIKMGNMLPRIPKSPYPQGRTEFEGLNDLLTYLNDDYGKPKEKIQPSPTLKTT